MISKTLLLFALLFTGLATQAQVSDPMITNWWFNTTGATYDGILTDVEATYYTSSNVYVKTSGVPDYYRDGVSMNNAKNLNAIWTIPRVPVAATTPASLAGGQEGAMMDGSVFFHPGDAQSYNGAGIWNRLAFFFEKVDMDSSNGHSTPDNMYHHHFDNLKMHNFDSTTHSPIVAFAWDGYPVYGPYGYANVDGSGGIKRMTSSYTTYSYTTRTDGPAVGGMYPIGCFIEDWQYVASSGTLDAHNGRFCVTPEYPSGTYAYFTSVDANLNPYYPYFIGPTFYGTFGNSNLGPAGGTTTVLPGDTTQYTTSVKEIAAIEANVSLYPVPVTDNLNIKLSENRPYTIVLYDLKGHILTKENITQTATLPMAGLPYGVYFVEVSDIAAQTGFVKRIVKL